MDVPQGEEAQEFDMAAQYVRTLSSLPVETMLEFYGLFKQAREGSCNVPKPGFFDFEGKKKWQAWRDVGNIPREEAKAKYVSVLDEVDPDWRDKAGAQDGVQKPKGFGVAVSSMMAPEEAAVHPEDKTVFDWVKEGDVARMRQILSSDPDPKALLSSSDPGGLTILHVAADRGDVDAVKCLVHDFGADVNIQDEDGQTALHYASSCGHAEVVEFLCSAGARTDVKDSEGYTAAQVAFDESIREKFSRLASQ